MKRYMGQLLATAILLAPQWLAASEPGAVSFARDVRPILSDRCFQCHGPDRISREADLRFDQEEVVLGDRGIVVPGDPESSELIARITSTDPDLVMPPADSGVDLSQEEIAVIRRWVSGGAVWQKHWAFIPAERPPLPDVSCPDWPRNPIDFFVLARMDAAGLSPSREADRRTLIRRVSLDLTGLPPTPEQVREFLDDHEPGAWDRVVQRLLDSAAYGERMALPWLEAARYADTSGYQEDYGRYMYPWRTWVIDAFNSNMPFDQFVTEQLAGDLLPEPTPEQILATAFNRNHRINQEVGSIPEEFLNEYAVDRVETVGTVLLGSTIGCARCHDHKYDPISQKEFYEFLAFFNNNDEAGVDQQSRFGYCKPWISYAPPADQPLLHSMEQRLAFLKSHDERTDEDEQEFREWKSSFANQPPIAPGDWYLTGPLSNPAQDVISGLTHVFPPERVVDLETGWTKRKDIAGGGLQTVGTEFATYFAYQTIQTTAPHSLLFHVAASDAVRVILNGETVFERAEEVSGAPRPVPVELPLKAGTNSLLVKLVNGDLIQAFGLHIPDRDFYTPDELGLIAAISERSAVDEQPLYDVFQRWRIRHEEKAIAAFRERYPKVMVMQERDKVRLTYVLNRGNYSETLEAVEPGTPDVLPPFPDDQPRNRLGLARWMTASGHPLLARVTINRFWQMYFGTGFVKSPEDLGLQSEWPSHPDLLDWLATEFVQSGWNVKHIQSLIVNSATYRQSSVTTEALQARDPENRLLARGPRRRLRPHFIRDQALFVSGLLVDEVGGPSVRPYQPEGLWEDVSNLLLPRIWYLTNRFEQDHGDSLYRKSLYTFWKRAVPPPNMSVFGAGTREACSVRLEITNTPLQALTLLNDVTFVEAARHLAHRMMTFSSDDAARLAWGMELAVCRPPDADEGRLLNRALERHRTIYRQAPEEAEKLLNHGESPRSGNHDPVEHAAWTQVALLLLNLDESMTRQ